MPPAELSQTRRKKEIEVVYDADINKKRTKAPRLLDRKAFAKPKHLLTWYSLGKL